MSKAISILIILCGLAAAIIIGLVPPWVYVSDFTYLDVASAKTEKPAGYALLTNPPQSLPNPVIQLMGQEKSAGSMWYLGSGVRVDVVRLGIEYLILLSIVISLLYLVHLSPASKQPKPKAEHSLSELSVRIVYRMAWLATLGLVLYIPVAIAMTWLLLRNHVPANQYEGGLIAGCLASAVIGYGLHRLDKRQYESWRLSALSWVVLLLGVVGLSTLILILNPIPISYTIPARVVAMTFVAFQCIAAASAACLLSNLFFFAFNESKVATNRAFCLTLLLVCAGLGYRSEQATVREYEIFVARAADENLRQALALLASVNAPSPSTSNQMVSAMPGNGSQGSLRVADTASKSQPPQSQAADPWAGYSSTPPQQATQTSQADPWAGYASCATQQTQQSPTLTDTPWTKNSIPSDASSHSAWSPPAKDFQQPSKSWNTSNAPVGVWVPINQRAQVSSQPNHPPTTQPLPAWMAGAMPVDSPADTNSTTVNQSPNASNPP